jgi:transcriptional regulator with XRE-family HTH domain
MTFMSATQKHSNLSVKVGHRLRRLRIENGMTQAELGHKLDVSFQQIQKYEHGRDAISVTKLITAASVLRVDPCVFWSDKLDNHVPNDLHPSQGDDKKMLTLVRAYRRISDPCVRQKVLELVTQIANSTPS